jgi:predicted extracellular nuclease
MKKFLLSVTIFATGLMGFSQVPCSELFFSEYVEGTGQNKAIEIFNPTTNTINLTGYYVYRYANGSTTQGDTLYLAGSLAPGTVYTAVNPDSATSATLVALADTLHTITFFNGDDALGLYNPSNTLIDVIGEIGVDPGTNWVVGSGATSEFTLVRKLNVFSGTTSWAVGATQWDVYPQNTFSEFGNHAIGNCATASVNDEQTWDVSIFPNPTSGTLNIRSEINDYTLQVFDLTGKSVITKTNLSENAQIDVADLTNGIYMVKLNNGSHQLTKKMIIKK